MLSHHDKCIFIHIPKTAGQSVESIFVERSGLRWENRQSLILRPNSIPSMGPPRLAHLTADEYIKLGYVSAETFHQYYTFSFVRNPWARLVSEYQYRKQHGDAVYQQEFKSFLFNSFPTPASDNHIIAKDYYRHVIPQWQFLYDEGGKCLVDFIGKFENLQHDFDKVCSELAIAQTILPHKNKTLATGIRPRIEKKLKQIFPFKNKQQHYSAYYDDESQQFVADYYQKDIELFHYVFERK
tara:strand:- start:12566 stop:13285 length:720 start_codon:yes stop_codon:yes gene_type:complete